MWTSLYFRFRNDLSNVPGALLYSLHSLHIGFLRGPLFLDL